MNTEQLNRLETLERVCEGLTQDHIDGGWSAKGIRNHCAAVERERDQLRSMFNAAVLDLVAVGEALGIPGERQEGGSAEFVEAIKRLSECARGVIPHGYALVPERLPLGAGAIEALAFVCGGPGDEQPFLDGVMWVGELVDDDGKPIHGLHAYCVECEEEGGTALAEFARMGLQLEWNGEGLPPVGARLECDIRAGVFVPCRVVAHVPHLRGEQAAVVVYDDGKGWDWATAGECFRPLQQEVRL